MRSCPGTRAETLPAVQTTRAYRVSFLGPFRGRREAWKMDFGLAWVHAGHSLMRSARELVWLGAVVSGTADCCRRARDADSFCLSLTAPSRAGPFYPYQRGKGAGRGSST